MSTKITEEAVAKDLKAALEKNKNLVEQLRRELNDEQAKLVREYGEAVVELCMCVTIAREIGVDRWWKGFDTAEQAYELAGIRPVGIS